VGEADLAVEGEWLAADVYGGGLCRAQVQRFGPKVRYSARIGTLQMDDLLAHARM
jgi:hypothetical protein